MWGGKEEDGAYGQTASTDTLASRSSSAGSGSPHQAALADLVVVVVDLPCKAAAAAAVVAKNLAAAPPPPREEQVVGGYDVPVTRMASSGCSNSETRRISEAMEDDRSIDLSLRFPSLSRLGVRWRIPANSDADLVVEEEELCELGEVTEVIELCDVRDRAYKRRSPREEPPGFCPASPRRRIALAVFAPKLPVMVSGPASTI